MANRYWVGGTGAWNTTNTANWSATSGGAGGASVPTTADAVIFNSASSAGNYTVTIGANVNCLTFNAAGPASGTATITMSGAFTLAVAGATFDVAATGVAFGGTTGTINCTTTTSLTITTNNVAMPWRLNLGVANKTVSFGSAFDNSGYTGTSFGLEITNITTLNLNGYSVTTASYRSQSSITVTLNFGSTGALYCTKLATSPTTFTASVGAPTAGTTSTGSKNVYLTRAAGLSFLTTNARNAFNSKANSLNYIVTGAGLNVGSVALTSDNLDVSAAAAWSGTGATGNTIYGNIVLGSSVNATLLDLTLSGGGTQTITSSGGQLLISSGALGLTVSNSTTVQLQSAVTVNGSGAARTLNLTGGTIDLNGYTMTLGSLMVLNTGSGSTARGIAFGSGGSLVMAGSGSVFTAAGTNVTTTGTGTISLTSGTAKTFAGGGFSYPTINQGGSGALTITGSNTFSNITNTTQPATVTLEFGTTNTFSNFSLNGTSGNLITLNSTSAGSQATISKSSGTVDAYFMSIQDSSATGGATWNAYSSTNAGNNTGWNFPVGATGNMFFLFK